MEDKNNSQNLRSQLSSFSTALRRKALSAGAVGDRIRVGDFESAFLKVITVVEFRAADKKGALRINHDIDSLGGNQNVTRYGAIDEIHLVLETGTAAAYHRHTECALWTSLLREQRSEPVRSGISDTA